VTSAYAEFPCDVNMKTRRGVITWGLERLPYIRSVWFLFNTTTLWYWVTSSPTSLWSFIYHRGIFYLWYFHKLYRWHLLKFM